MSIAYPVSEVYIADCIPKDGYYFIVAETLSHEFGLEMWPDGTLRENSLYLINSTRGRAVIEAAKQAVLRSAKALETCVNLYDNSPNRGKLCSELLPNKADWCSVCSARERNP